ncbi:hypothetical protein DFJ73DRAFT_763204 [Zopfochytrium polystomum]|nr:hypothetical protein DFJ73DRAFT_763204 [Zopfochytrium polystomum]
MVAKPSGSRPQQAAVAGQVQVPWRGAAGRSAGNLEARALLVRFFKGSEVALRANDRRSRVVRRAVKMLAFPYATPWTYCTTRISAGTQSRLFTLPNPQPKQNTDGSWYAYTVQSGNTCEALDTKYNLKTQQIESFNTLTIGWLRRNKLQSGAVILSVHWSMVNGKRNGTCVLNTCCSKWGFCGTTSDFCAPGCQSNCGMGYPPICYITSPTHSQYRVGYYATWTRGNA